MTLVFACEARFLKYKGVIYSENESFGDHIWRRYLEVFDDIIVFARVMCVDNTVDPNQQLWTIHPKVSFMEVPCYIGPRAYLRKRNVIQNMAEAAALPSRAYICRVPGQIGTILSAALQRKRIPYAVEVVGDPWDVFAPKAMSHPLSPLFRIMGRLSLARVVKKASAALYVTKNQLQKRYPCQLTAYTTYASDVVLTKSHLPPKRRQFSANTQIRLTAVGSLAQMYKSPDVAIATIAELKRRGLDCVLTWLGDGVYRQEMEILAEKLNLSDRVIFKGNVSSKQVEAELADTDIFLHISRTEGLPRAVVEAMGIGLPCIGSRVGGIPELLDDVALVDNIAPTVVAQKIIDFISTPNLMSSQAHRNSEESKQYLDSVLSSRRVHFYKTVVQIVQNR